MDTKTNPWLIEDNTIYMLQETGNYKKGEPILENKFSIHIQGQANNSEKQELAQQIFVFLKHLYNYEDYVTVSDELAQIRQILKQKLEFNKNRNKQV